MCKHSLNAVGARTPRFSLKKGQNYLPMFVARGVTRENFKYIPKQNPKYLNIEDIFLNFVFGL